MPDEFFPPLPAGSLRLSRQYIARMQREVERASRSPASPSYPGNAGVDTCGFYIDPQFDQIIFAEITAQPTGIYSGYSWQQRVPGVDGAWEIPAHGMLQGDNGSQSTFKSAALSTGSITDNVATIVTDAHEFEVGDRVVIDALDVDENASIYNGEWIITSVSGDTTFTFHIGHVNSSEEDLDGDAAVQARPAYQAAFAMDGDESILVGEKVGLVRGYFYHAEGSWQWLIIRGGGSGKASLVRTTGRPFEVEEDSTTYLVYPAVLVHDNTTGLGYHDGTAIWLVNVNGDPLDTLGTVVYEASRKLASYEVQDCDDEMVARQLWRTTERVHVVAWDEDNCRPYYSGEYEGTAICETLTMESEDITFGGELIGVS